MPAHQEDGGVGAGIGLVGCMAICVTMWFVAWRSGVWRLDGGNAALSACLAGVIAVSAAGATAVVEVVLATRGESVEVTLVEFGEPDSDGAGVVVLAAVTLGSGFPLLGGGRDDRAREAA